MSHTALGSLPSVVSAQELAAPARQLLVVDDDDDLREFVTTLLSGEGYQVESAANGREALLFLQARRASPPALLIVDINMPVMDGPELLLALERDGALGTIPALLVSAAPPDTGTVHSLRHDRRFLFKPLDVKELLDAVESCEELGSTQRP